MSKTDDAYRRGYADGWKAAEAAAKKRVLDRIATAREKLAQWGGHWGRPKRLTDDDMVRIRELRDKGHSIRNVARMVKAPSSTVARALVGYKPSGPLLVQPKEMNDEKW